MKKRRIKSAHLAIYAASLAALAVFLFPFAWLLITSFKPEMHVWARPPVWVFKPTVQNYIAAFADKGLSKYLLNSLQVSAAVTAFSILVGSIAAYSIARFKTGGRGLMFDFLTYIMMPPIVVAIPFFLLMKTLGLLDTKTALFASYLVFGLPFSIWMMRGIFIDIPADFEEAALLDGCTRLGALMRVIIPMSLPGLVATAILVFIFSWNEYLFALVLTSDKAQTLPIIAATSITMHKIQWGQMAAIGTIAVLPVLAFAFAIRRYLIRGLTFGAVR